MSLAELEQGFTVDTEEDVFVVQQVGERSGVKGIAECVEWSMAR